MNSKFKRKTRTRRSSATVFTWSIILLSYVWRQKLRPRLSIHWVVFPLNAYYSLFLHVLPFSWICKINKVTLAFGLGNLICFFLKNLKGKLILLYKIICFINIIKTLIEFELGLNYLNFEQNLTQIEFGLKKL